jgi:hypothetical protein
MATSMVLDCKNPEYLAVLANSGILLAWPLFPELENEENQLSSETIPRNIYVQHQGIFFALLLIFYFEEWNRTQGLCVLGKHCTTEQTPSHR